MAFIERCKRAAKAVKQAALDLTDLEMWVPPAGPGAPSAAAQGWRPGVPPPPGDQGWPPRVADFVGDLDASATPTGPANSAPGD